MSPGVILELIRERPCADARSALIETTGLSRSTILQRLGVLLASRLVVEGAGGRDVERRPPADRAAVQRGRRPRARGRPRRPARARRGLRPRRARARRGGAADRHRRRPRRDPGLADRDVRPACSPTPGGPPRTCCRSASGCPGRSTSPPAARSTRRSCRAGTATRSPTCCRSTTTRPAVVDNDVNIMAVGEHRVHLAEPRAPRVRQGGHRDRRGRDHQRPRLPRHARRGGRHRPHPLAAPTPTCCARAATAAASARSRAARRSRASSRPTGSTSPPRSTSSRSCAQAEPRAIARVRDAGRLLGEALASVVSVLAPTAIVVGGEMAEAREPLLAGIRETIYQRSLPLATRELAITTSRLGRRAGLVGRGHRGDRARALAGRASTRSSPSAWWARDAARSRPGEPRPGRRRSPSGWPRRSRPASTAWRCATRTSARRRRAGRRRRADPDVLPGGRRLPRRLRPRRRAARARRRCGGQLDGIAALGGRRRDRSRGLGHVDEAGCRRSTPPPRTPEEDREVLARAARRARRARGRARRRPRCCSSRSTATRTTWSTRSPPARRARARRPAATALGVLADTYHMNIEEDDVCAALRAAAPWLGAVHLSDSNRHHPGRGHVDFAAVLATLRDAGFAGTLSVECRPRGELGEELAACGAHLRGLARGLELMRARRARPARAARGRDRPAARGRAARRAAGRRRGRAGRPGRSCARLHRRRGGVPRRSRVALPGAAAGGVPRAGGGAAGRRRAARPDPRRLARPLRRLCARQARGELAARAPSAATSTGPATIRSRTTCRRTGRSRRAFPRSTRTGAAPSAAGSGDAPGRRRRLHDPRPAPARVARRGRPRTTSRPRGSHAFRSPPSTPRSGRHTATSSAACGRRRRRRTSTRTASGSAR